MRVLRGLAAMSIALSLSCGSSEGETLLLDSVAPNTALVGERKAATLTGSNFHHAVSVQIDENKPATIERDWAVAIGDLMLDPSDVVYVGPTRIDIVIPDTLAAGDYDLTVYSPLSDEVMMPNAIHVQSFAMADAGMPSDAGIPSNDAGPMGAFGPGTLITEISDPAAGDDDPTLSADLLEIYFDSNRGGSGDIWTSTRPTVSDAWAPPTRVAELSTADSETTPMLAPDGLTIYIASSRPGGLGNSSIWRSTRTTRTAPWTAPVYVAALDSVDSDNAPTVDAAMLHMLFSSQRAGGASDLYKSSRATPTSNWDPPTPVTELNTADSDSNPHLSPNGLVLTFSSIRAGGMGDTDIYITSRASLASPFDPPIAISELNTADSDADPWLSGDKSTIFFSSSRSGNSELYYAIRGP